MPVAPPFDQIIVPRSLDELIGAISRDDEVRFWRGMANEAWLLDSTLVRRLRAFGRPVGEREARWAEETLLERARHRGFDVVNGVRLTDFELLALLRHHGAATRLIDFSRSATIALWFAAVDPDQRGVRGQLIGIHTDLLGGYEATPINKSYEAAVDSAARYQHPQTWEPTRMSPRVFAQHSQFFYGTVTDQAYGSLTLGNTTQGRILTIAIEPEMKPIVLRFLRNALDIGMETLFPDIAGFGKTFDAAPVEEPWRW